MKVTSITTESKKSTVSKGILKRIDEEYSPTLDFLTSQRDPLVGFWTSVRMIMPIVETASALKNVKPQDLLGDLGVPEPKIAWQMFRNGLSHSEIPFVISYDGVVYNWAITFDLNHRMTQSNVIYISTPRLLSDLKEFVAQFVDDDSSVIMQVGKSYET